MLQICLEFECYQLLVHFSILALGGIQTHHPPPLCMVYHQVLLSNLAREMEGLESVFGLTPLVPNCPKTTI